MTNLDDLDRALAEFLEDGPNTAPEAPVIAALAHARTTPRRPDPLARLRSDVMAAPRGRILGLRPSLVLAVVALVVGVGRDRGRRLAPAGAGGRGARAVPTCPDVEQALTSTGAVASLASQRPTYDLPITMLVSAGQPYPIEVSGHDERPHRRDAPCSRAMARRLARTSCRSSRIRADLKALIVTWSGTPCESHGLPQRR